MMTKAKHTGRLDILVRNRCPNKDKKYLTLLTLWEHLVSPYKETYLFVKKKKPADFIYNIKGFH